MHRKSSTALFERWTKISSFLALKAKLNCQMYALSVKHRVEITLNCIRFPPRISWTQNFFFKFFTFLVFSYNFLCYNMHKNFSLARFFLQFKAKRFIDTSGYNNTAFSVFHSLFLRTRFKKHKKFFVQKLELVEQFFEHFFLCDFFHSNFLIILSFTNCAKTPKTHNKGQLWLKSH